MSNGPDFSNDFIPLRVSVTETSWSENRPPETDLLKKYFFLKKIMNQVENEYFIIQ